MKTLILVVGITSLLMFAGTGNCNSVSNIQLSPSSPTTLNFEEYVRFTFDYSTEDTGGVLIFIRPVSNGLLAPNSASHASPLYPVGSGSSSGFFTILSGKITVDQLRVQIKNADQSQTLLEIFIPVEYHFGITTDIIFNELKLLPSNRTYGFGGSVSIDGDYAVVGASGVAFVFKKSGNDWIEQKILHGEGNPQGSTLPPDFGYSVCISGDYVIVGAPFQVVPPIMSNIGAAFIFKRNGEDWELQEKIPPPVGHLFGLFGWSVAISSSFAVVGEASNSSTHIYRRFGESWTFDSTLGGGWRLGESVAISDNYVSTGTPGGYILNTDGQGSAYVFFNQGTDWAEQAKLQARDGSDIDGFGEALSISGTTLLAGDDKAKNTDSISTGAAYIFNRDGTFWEEEQKITANDGSLGDLFGAAVSISDSFAIVSAPEDQDKGIRSGSVYLFMQNGVQWIQKQKLLASDGEPNDNFGKSVSISGNNIIVGANGDDDNGNNSGSAYIYSDFFTNIDNKQISKPQSFYLSQNYPNPFNPLTTINYTLQNESKVNLSVFDITGREIKTLVNQSQNIGNYSVSFDASNLASGIYFYKLKAGAFQRSRKMILLR